MPFRPADEQDALVQAEWVKIDCAKELSGPKKHAGKASVAKAEHGKHSADKKVDDAVDGKGDDEKEKPKAAEEK